MEKVPTKQENPLWPKVIVVILILLIAYFIWVQITNNKEEACRKEAQGKSVIAVMYEKPYEPDSGIRESKEKALEFQLLTECMQRNGIK